MVRIVTLLLIITLLSLGVAWIADEPGRVAIDWGDYHIETSLLATLAGIAIGALWCMLAYYTVFAILRTPRSWLRSRLARRQALGLEALTAAFAAIATQDIRAARKQIGRARQYLPHQPLTLMLASQVARLEGNESQSRLYLEQMLKSEPTEFMALRGLIENARRAGDEDAALAHAQKALTVKEKDPWLIRTLIGLYARKSRTEDAVKLIDKAARRRIFSRAEQQGLTSGVLYLQAKLDAAQLRFDQAVPALQDALRLKPAFAPASALLAEIYIEDSDVEGALAVLKKAWKAAPDPQLTQALLKCFAPAKTRDKVARLAEKLAKLHPENRESRFLLAEMALKAGDADIARNELHYLIDKRETARACTLMAQAESVSGNTSASSEWMTRSHSALPDPHYACMDCNQPQESWQFTCRHCGGVGTAVMR